MLFIVLALRSPYLSNSQNVRNVNTTGTASNNNARNNNGIAPARVESELRVSPHGEARKSKHHTQGTSILAPKKAKMDIDATYLNEVIVATNNGMENL